MSKKTKIIIWRIRITNGGDKRTKNRRIKIKELLGEIEVAQVKRMQQLERGEVLKILSIEELSQRDAARILGVRVCFQSVREERENRPMLP